MKQFYFTLLMVSAMAWQITYASETEPNNTSAQANVLALNSGDSGKINPAGDIDWWKVTTTADGKLNITLSNLTDSIRVYLYDINGTTLLSSGNSNTTFALRKDGLAAGTYYIKVQCVWATLTAAYAISNSLEVPAQANDAEPNDSKAQAAILTLNSIQTGHIGYYYKSKRDTTDWYKITTTSDGKLNLSLTPANSTNTWIYLYDNDGTTLLNSKNSAVPFTLGADGLASGTYYVKIKCVASANFTPYTLTNNLETPGEANDAEPNNTRAEAVSLTLNSTQTGHVGYYYAKKRDTADWYSVTTDRDGKLNLTFTSVNGKYTWIKLFDKDGTTLLNSKDSTAFTLATDGLAAGTYFIKIHSADSAGFTAYSLINKLEPTNKAIDAEPNNSKGQAITLSLNSSKTGHVGYYYDKKRDSSDWYKITTNADSKITLKLALYNGQPVTVSLYASNGTSLINWFSSGKNFSLVTDGLEDDTYYVKINCKNADGFAPYTLTDSITRPTNDTLILPLNYRIKDVLTPQGDADWFKVTTTADGILNLTLTSLSGNYVWVYLYDHDRTTERASIYTNGSILLSTDGLGSGTYYVKVTPYYSSDTSSYLLADTLKLHAQANDAEPNNSRAQAIALKLNASKAGLVGFIYNNKRDTADWYKITTVDNGTLNLNLTSVNGIYALIDLYDNDGIKLLKEGYTNAAFTLSQDGLAAGTYYVKVTCYYNSEFTPYILSANVVKPALANDKEPNNTPAQARPLNVNSKVTGHIGYYYNNKNDTSDWYKVTTTKNGLLKITLTPANLTYIYAYIYDKNGTTLLRSDTYNTTFVVNADGLAAGTYYIKVTAYYTNEFTPYTLTDSLLTYSYATETEPNNYPYQAKSISPNTTVTGDVNFYYNLAEDKGDWWKLNYTGSGSLQFVLNLAPKKSTGITPYTYFYVYKDTSSSPVFGTYFNTSPNVINLSSLGKGTYYIQIITYYSSDNYDYNNDFVAYSFSNSFTPSAAVTASALHREIFEDELSPPGDNVTTYPNPVSNRLHIQVNSELNNLASVILRDANDKKVWSKSNLANINRGGSLDVNVKNFPAGIYFLQMTDVNGKNTIKKIIIVK